MASEYILHGRRVSVIGEANADRAGGGRRVPYVQIWEMDDGKAKRVDILTDTLAIARALKERDLELGVATRACGVSQIRSSAPTIYRS